MGTLCDDQYAFSYLEVTNWESALLWQVITKTTQRSLSPGNSDVTGAIHRGQILANTLEL
jgi:hypothetical protein